MNLQNVTVLCLRESDYLKSKDSFKKSNLTFKTLQVEVAECENCGERVLAKNKLGLAKVRCLDCYF